LKEKNERESQLTIIDEDLRLLRKKEEKKKTKRLKSISNSSRCSRSKETQFEEGILRINEFYQPPSTLRA